MVLLISLVSKVMYLLRRMMRAAGRVDHKQNKMLQNFTFKNRSNGRKSYNKNNSNKRKSISFPQKESLTQLQLVSLSRIQQFSTKITLITNWQINRVSVSKQGNSEIKTMQDHLAIPYLLLMNVPHVGSLKFHNSSRLQQLW